MTTVVANTPFTNLFILGDLSALVLAADYTATTMTPTNYQASSVTAGIVWKATGTGFAYLDDTLVGGTVMTLEVTRSAVVAYTMTGPFTWTFLTDQLNPGGTGAPFFNGNDTITGSNSGTLQPNVNDMLFGYDGSDTISARGGNDLIWGGKGNDTLDGGDGNDTILGETGADAFIGGSGNDTFLVIGADGAGDTFQGGTGTDTLVISPAFLVSGVLTNFNALASSIEILKGNGLPILGTSGANTIDLSGLQTIENVPYVDGGGGNDVLVGSNLGADDLRGGAGDDTIGGNGGEDAMSGGTGDDTFLFAVSIAAANLKRLLDFVSGDDEIELDKSFFKGLKVGDLGKKAFFAKKNADKAADKDDRIIYDTKSGELWIDKDGKGGAKAKLFAVLDGSSDKLAASDIVVVA